MGGNIGRSKPFEAERGGESREVTMSWLFLKGKTKGGQTGDNPLALPKNKGQVRASNDFQP